MLTSLSLELEDIRSQALFRAAMQLGAQIAQPGPLTPHPYNKAPG